MVFDNNKVVRSTIGNHLQIDVLSEMKGRDRLVHGALRFITAQTHIFAKMSNMRLNGPYSEERFECTLCKLFIIVYAKPRIWAKFIFACVITSENEVLIILNYHQFCVTILLCYNNHTVYVAYHQGLITFDQSFVTRIIKTTLSLLQLPGSIRFENIV